MGAQKIAGRYVRLYENLGGEWHLDADLTASTAALRRAFFR